MKQKNQSDKITRTVRSWRYWTRLGLLSIGIASTIALLLALTYLAWLIPSLPEVDDLQKVRLNQPSVVVTADGTPLTEFRRVYQEYVTLDQLSPHILPALIATEDHRFYSHRGIDLRRTGSAIWHTLHGNDQGGSTITQQLARNLYPEKIGRSRTVSRKIKEMMTAVKIERHYSKRQILETYLNTVPFLYNVVGIEMAARTYFDKPAAELDVLESATLVGMLKGTQYYNPVKNPERALKRRNVVLMQMVKHKHLPADDFARLSNQPLEAQLYRQNAYGDIAPHFTMYVRKWLIDWADKHDYDLYADGLMIQTTLDLPLQAAAERAVERQTSILQQIADVEWSQNKPPTSLSTSFYTQQHKKVASFHYLWNSRPDLVDAFVREAPAFKKAVAGGAKPSAALAKLKSNKKFMQQLLASKSRLEAGFLAMDPATGEIKAWVGSRDFRVDQFDHVAQAARQPGSTFKPFVYGAALERGFSPNRTYQGGPVEILLTDGTLWKPTDMDTAGRPMTLREGLIHSKNTITAQVIQDVGVDPVVDLAQAMGVRHSKLDPVVSIALGTSPVTLLEMVSSYATIAATGSYHPPVAVKRITDRTGSMIAEFGTEKGEEVLSAHSSAMLIDMMRGVVNQGTGQKIKNQFGLTADFAGKTGTTQNNTDGWFIMMHPNLVAGAWIGFNDQRVRMRSDYWGQGGHNAILVVGDFFREVLKNGHIDVKAKFPRPSRFPHLVNHGNLSDEFPSQSSRMHQEETGFIDSGTLASSQEIIVRRKNGKTMIGDARGIQSLEQEEPATRKKSAEELARILLGARQDRLDSEGASQAVEASGTE